MTPLRILMDTSQPPDGQPILDRNRQILEGKISVIGGLPKGMKSGAPSVSMVVQLKNGAQVFAETSMKLFLMAAKMLRAEYQPEEELLEVAGKTIGQITYEAFKKSDAALPPWSSLAEPARKRWEAAGKETAGVVTRELLADVLGSPSGPQH